MSLNQLETQLKNCIHQHLYKPYMHCIQCRLVFTIYNKHLKEVVKMDNEKEQYKKRFNVIIAKIKNSVDCETRCFIHRRLKHTYIENVGYDDWICLAAIEEYLDD